VRVLAGLALGLALALTGETPAAHAERAVGKFNAEADDELDGFADDHELDHDDGEIAAFEDGTGYVPGT